MPYPHFIQVTNGVLEALVNIDQIKFVRPHPAFLASAEIHFADGTDEPMITEESYEDVEKLIRDSGSSINRPDPRLHTNSALTMNQIMRMIGEPVWNIHLSSWALVYEYDPDHDVIKLRNADGKMYVMTEYEMIKYPLLRMKTEKEIE